MKDTYLPLDIIFINGSRQVTNVEQAAPEPDTPEENLTIYRSQRPARYVVETRQGWAEAQGITPGTSVEWHWLAD